MLPKLEQLKKVGKSRPKLNLKLGLSRKTKNTTDIMKSDGRRCGKASI